MEPFCSEVLLGSEIDHKEALIEETLVELGEEAVVRPEGKRKEDEVVNCICQLNEENGLMIQVSRHFSQSPLVFA